MDFYFLITVFVLLAFGLIMVMSSSSESARSTMGDAYYFIKRQSIWALVSVVLLLFFANFDYHKLAKMSGYIFALTVLLLILVLAIGTEAKGGKRWLFGFQPSEVAKIGLIIFLSESISKNKKYIKTFKRGLLPNLIAIGLVCGLIVLEPHLSATLIIAAVGIIMLVVGDADLKKLVPLGVGGGILAVILVLTSSYRRARLFSFMDPFADPLGDGYQVIQSLYAIGSGGLFGLGIGQSRQKFLYIPEPHNDFIFAILCEETGFVGALVVLVLFGFLVYRGIRIGLKAKDKLGCLMAIGITSLIGLEVIMNIAVVTSSIPVTGISLPFFSYGGTALSIIMASMGIVLNISRQGSK